jgi:transcriptional regulator with XRE-family HTH domain
MNGLKLARLQAGLRQIDLAKAVDVSESQIAKWETGRLTPRQEMAERLAQVLGATTQQISSDYDLRALRTPEAMAR